MSNTKSIVVTALICPIHQFPLELHTITQGEKKGEIILLGYLYLCPFAEWGSERAKGLECDTLVDADMDQNPIIEAYKQLELPSEA